MNWDLVLFLVILKNSDDCTVTMGVACPLLRRSLSGLIFFFGRGFNLEIFLNLQGSEFIQTLLLIYNHLAKFVVYKSWTRSALLKGTSRCFLVSSITCRSKEAIEWVWSFFVVKLSTKPHPLLVLCFHRQ